MSAAAVRDLPVANIQIVRDFLFRTIGNAIHIVVITPDGQPLPYGRWFGDDAEEAAQWCIAENRKGYNVYWTVNLVREGFWKKPKKSDITGARFLHVDIDPPADGSQFDRQAKLDVLDDMSFGPSFITDSGNGIQAFWRLDATSLNQPAIERLNRQLSHLLGGDHCHNIDRLMRVPGTINFPDAKKRSRGRVPVMASVISADTGVLVEASDMHATLPEAPVGAEQERVAVQLASVEAVSLESLSLASVDPLRVILLTTEPGDRSDRVLRAAGMMVRRGYSDSIIAGILTNPSLPISAHCLEKPDPLRPALRAISRARSDQADDPGNGPPEYGSMGGSGGGNTPANPPPPPPPPASGGAIEVSEDSIARAFTETYGDTLRFDHDAGRWFRWDGSHWMRDGTDLAIHYTRKFARELGDGKRALCKASVASGAERFARADRAHAVTQDVWDADPFLLGTPGGTVDLRTGEMSDPDPGQFISKLTAITPEHGEPELWLRFLREAMGGDEERVTFLQQWCGYCLTGDTREHALVFAYGDGGNGKSVFLNTLTSIMGDYAVTAAMETFTASKHDRHSTELAMLKGARLVTASETEEGRAWAEAKIKAITGGDPITARFMRQDNFTFRSQFKIVVVGNHMPTLRNVDEAMKRRFNIVPFTTKPVAPDRQLERRLEAEWGKILAWMIRGCREWLSDGLKRPSAVLEATKDYFSEQDLAGQWFEERCEVTPGRHFETVAKFYADWTSFAKEHGEEPGSSKAFGSMMRKRGFVSAWMRTSGIAGKVYKGIRLNNQEVDGGF